MPDPTAPSPGDVLFCCEHCPNPLRANLHFVNELLVYEKRGGADNRILSRLLAKWLVLCSECEDKFGDDVLSAVAGGKLPIGGDMTWPDADVETLQVRQKADELIDEKCPPGWTKEMVRPPWAHTKGRCRSCGKTQDKAASMQFGIATLLRFDSANKVLKFSFAMVCADCKENQGRMLELSKRVFESQ